MRLTPFALLLITCFLAGCPAFLVERGEIVEPARTLELPRRSDLPKADAFIEMQDRWRRETRVGIGGAVTATLIEPHLASADVVHTSALNNATNAQVADLLATRWPVLFGSNRDRFPIDLAWRFDEQFISNKQILDPNNWTFTLENSDGRRFKPLGATVLRANPTPQGGVWVGQVRIWFPWVDPERRTPVLGGAVNWARLIMSHPSGTGEVLWRFRAAW